MNRLQRMLNDRVARSTRPIRSVATHPVAMHPSTDATDYSISPPDLGFAHRLFIPEHFESHYEYPLIVWLHSDHSSEWELDSIMEATSVRNYLAIAPRGHRVSKRSSRLFRWGTNVADLAVAEDFVHESIDEVLEVLPVHPGRIFLAGIGTGATVAQWIGLKHPERFAGVVSINGAFPKSRRALSSWKQARRLPVLFLQGAKSKRCCDSELIDTMQMAHTAGLAYRFLRFETRSEDSAIDPCAQGSEEIDVEMLSAANRFLMGIVTNSEIPLTAEEPASSLAVAAGSVGTAFGWN
jgi:phospholipase/carboxylesterase